MAYILICGFPESTLTDEILRSLSDMLGDLLRVIWGGWKVGGSGVGGRVYIWRAACKRVDHWSACSESHCKTGTVYDGWIGGEYLAASHLSIYSPHTNSLRQTDRPVATLSVSRLLVNLSFFLPVPPYLCPSEDCSLFFLPFSICLSLLSHFYHFMDVLLLAIYASTSHLLSTVVIR